jgi:hypothetical protein
MFESNTDNNPAQSRVDEDNISTASKALPASYFDFKNLSSIVPVDTKYIDNKNPSKEGRYSNSHFFPGESKEETGQTVRIISIDKSEPVFNNNGIESLISKIELLNEESETMSLLGKAKMQNKFDLVNESMNTFKTSNSSSHRLKSVEQKSEGTSLTL